LNTNGKANAGRNTKDESDQGKDCEGKANSKEMKLELPNFAEKSELIDYLVSNKSKLISQKKSVTKEADGVTHSVDLVIDKDKSEFTVKAGMQSNEIADTATQIKVRSIINTTKLFDSHGDVHLDQLWNKSLKENKGFSLIQEHQFNFKGTISDNVKAFTKQIAWHDMGINFEGKTQALVFDSLIDKNENEFMFEKYRTGKVNNHSVGMQYVKIDLAVNDDRYEKEYAIWGKYFDEIANKEDVLEAGYFWAVSEAKIIEGSAVKRGSNWATPTLSIEQTKEEPPVGTPKTEPPKSTLKAKELIKYYQPKNHI
jgi:hypothetical protein